MQLTFDIVWTHHEYFPKHSGFRWGRTALSLVASVICVLCCYLVYQWVATPILRSGLPLVPNFAHLVSMIPFSSPKKAETYSSSGQLYMGDTGLLISHAFDENSIVSEGIYKKLLFGKLEVNKGMLMENIVAQMLVASGHKLYFYSNSSREDKNARMEIDFLISKKEITDRHNIPLSRSSLVPVIR